MASNIDPERPNVGVPRLTKDGFEDNFNAAKDEIEDLQSRVTALEGGGGGFNVDQYDIAGRLTVGTGGLEAVDIATLTDQASPASTDDLLAKRASDGALVKIEVGNLPGGDVTSVFTRTGAVVAASDDYDDAQVTAAASATNYTPGSSTVDGHLSGIDTALGTVGAVASVFTRTGAIVAVSGDYDADEIDETASNKIMTAAERTKLAGIETAATADQTGAEIKTAYEGEADTNAFDDAAVSKLAGIEASANAPPFVTADYTDASVTFAKIQNVSAQWRILGRIGAGAGVTEEIDVSALTDQVSPAGGDLILAERASDGNLVHIQVGNLPTGGGGEANLGSNLGAGVGVFEGKSGVTLQFNSLVSQNTALTIAEDDPNDEIDFDLDINAATDLAAPATGDELLIGDVSDSNDVKKADLASIVNLADHDALTNFVADEHVAHAGVTLTAGDGLAGGGTIAANRTFNVDISGATDDAAPARSDEILFDDGAIKKSDIGAVVDLAKPLESFIIAASDKTTSITTGTNKSIPIRMPYAFVASEVRANVDTAPTGAAITIDINENGTTILSTKLTIDATETTSTTAAVAAVISDANLADDAEITIDFDVVGSTEGGVGVVVSIIGRQA